MEFDPETRDMRKILALVRENNEMIRDMEGSRKRAAFFKFIYWVVFIAGLIAAYIYLKPWFERAQEAYKEAAATVQTVGTAGSKLLGGDTAKPKE